LSIRTERQREDPIVAPVSDRQVNRHSLISPLLTGNLQSKLLRGLSLPERKAILMAASYRRFQQRSVAAHQHDTADRLFLLLKGVARYFFITPAGHQVYLLWLAPGDVFGLSTLLAEPMQFLVSTEVDKDSHVLVWQRDTIRQLATKHVALLENGLAIANDYLTWYLATHLSLIYHNARQRLAHVLLTLARGIGHKLANGVLLDITNEQLANTANITLFTVSRLMGEWKRMGVIEKARGRVVLLHPDSLA
jgi:CRP/FNR family transcriptional regulator, nitrogen oxide reductase regulator